MSMKPAGEAGFCAFRAAFELCEWDRRISDQQQFRAPLPQGPGRGARDRI